MALRHFDMTLLFFISFLLSGMFATIDNKQVEIPRSDENSTRSTGNYENSLWAVAYV